jgi:hypothetical protein
MSLAWCDVYKEFNMLQLKFFRTVKQDRFPEPKADISKVVGEIKFISHLFCLILQSSLQTIVRSNK